MACPFKQVIDWPYSTVCLSPGRERIIAVAVPLPYLAILPMYKELRPFFARLRAALCYSLVLRVVYRARTRVTFLILLPNYCRAVPHEFVLTYLNPRKLANLIYNIN